MNTHKQEFLLKKQWIESNLSAVIIKNHRNKYHAYMEDARFVAPIANSENLYWVEPTGHGDNEYVSLTRLFSKVMEQFDKGKKLAVRSGQGGKIISINMDTLETSSEQVDSFTFEKPWT